jgi:hypothetical protein
MADAAGVIPVNRSECEEYSGGDGIRSGDDTPRGPRGDRVAVPAASFPASPLARESGSGSRSWRRAA